MDAQPYVAPDPNAPAPLTSSAAPIPTVTKQPDPWQQLVMAMVQKMTAGGNNNSYQADPEMRQALLNALQQRSGGNRRINARATPSVRNRYEDKPGAMTPQSDWAVMFRPSGERAQLEADAFGIPVEQTGTGRANALNAMSTNDRMNANLGFTPDMSPMDKRNILATLASSLTGKPLSSYQPDPVTQENANGGLDISGPFGQGYSYLSKGGAENNLPTFDGVAMSPAPSQAQNPTALPFNQKEWESKNPEMATAIRNEVYQKFGLPLVTASSRRDSNAGKTPDFIRAENKARRTVARRNRRQGVNAMGMPDTNPVNAVLGMFGL